MFVPARVARAVGHASAGHTIRLLPKMAIEPLSLVVNTGANGTIDVASTLVDGDHVITDSNNASAAVVHKADRRESDLTETDSFTADQTPGRAEVAAVDVNFG